MSYTIDRYLSTLLAFTSARSNEVRDAGDFACLIQVPANGAESVHNVSLQSSKPLYTLAAFEQSVSTCIEAGEWIQPSVDVIQAQISEGHPALEFLCESFLKDCSDFSDGCAGLDYYLLIYQFGSEMQTVECWEPYGRNNSAWKQVIGAFQVLGNHFSKISKSNTSGISECCDSAL